MGTSKIAVTIDTDLLGAVDRLVSTGVFPNRSRAVSAAVRQLTRDEGRARFRRELAKLDPAEEKKLAAEFGDGGVPWPRY